MQRIEVNGKSWAVGFWWQQKEQSPRKQVASLNEQLQESTQQPYNVYVPLGELIGVGHYDNPKDASRVPSLAGAFARVYGQTQNVLAFLRFDDGTAWLFALKDGVILPQGDLFAAEEELQRRLSQYRQNKAWHQVVETDSSEESLDRIREITGQLGKWLPAVSPVTSNVLADTLAPFVLAHPKRLILVGLVLIVGLGGFYGAKQYQAYKAKQARMEQLREKRQELEEQRKDSRRSLAELKRMYFPPEWRQEPAQENAVRDCYRKMIRVPVITQGWTVENVACTPGKVVVTRKRSEFGTFVSLPEGADFQVSSPNTVLETRGYGVSERDTERDLGSQTKVSANIYELGRRLQSSVKLTWTKPKPAPVKDKHKEYNPNLPEKIKSPYWHGKWELKGVPEAFLRDPQALSVIPGLVVNKLKRTPKDKWNLKGEVYASSK